MTRHGDLHDLVALTVAVHDDHAFLLIALREPGAQQHFGPLDDLSLVQAPSCRDDVQEVRLRVRVEGAVPEVQALLFQPRVCQTPLPAIIVPRELHGDRGACRRPRLAILSPRRTESHVSTPAYF